mmetsp:Transcript_50352/g.42486  ORF Transcript_50352/g.42486 Transcript_50352/m.42486 type:complete len:94 (-) Transcript_50352:365-646(-)
MGAADEGPWLMGIAEPIGQADPIGIADPMTFPVDIGIAIVRDCGPADIVCRSVPPKGSVELEKTGWPFTIAVGTRPLDPTTGPMLMLGNAVPL